VTVFLPLRKGFDSLTRLMTLCSVDLLICRPFHPASHYIVLALLLSSRSVFVILFKVDWIDLVTPNDWV
jgi:hypothetical protein